MLSISPTEVFSAPDDQPAPISLSRPLIVPEIEDPEVHRGFDLVPQGEADEGGLRGGCFSLCDLIGLKKMV